MAMLRSVTNDLFITSAASRRRETDRFCDLVLMGLIGKPDQIPPSYFKSKLVRESPRSFTQNRHPTRGAAYLCVNEQRQNQHRQQQVCKRQTHYEVVRGRLQSLLQTHADAHQHVPRGDGRDQQNPKYEHWDIVVGDRSHRQQRVVVGIGGVFRHGRRCCAVRRNLTGSLSD